MFAGITGSRTVGDLEVGCCRIEAIDLNRPFIIILHLATIPRNPGPTKQQINMGSSGRISTLRRIRRILIDVCVAQIQISYYIIIVYTHPLACYSEEAANASNTSLTTPRSLSTLTRQLLTAKRTAL